jgi:hypothetical protein
MEIVPVAWRFNSAFMLTLPPPSHMGRVLVRTKQPVSEITHCVLLSLGEFVRRALRNQMQKLNAYLDPCIFSMALFASSRTVGSM